MLVVADAELGAAARRVAQLAPDVPVVALTPSLRVARQLSLSRGVLPKHVPDLGALDAAAAAAHGFAHGDRAVVYLGGAVSLHDA